MHSNSIAFQYVFLFIWLSMFYRRNTVENSVQNAHTKIDLSICKFWMHLDINYSKLTLYCIITSLYHSEKNKYTVVCAVQSLKRMIMFINQFFICDFNVFLIPCYRTIDLTCFSSKFNVIVHILIEYTFVSVVSLQAVLFFSLFVYLFERNVFSFVYECTNRRYLFG